MKILVAIANYGTKNDRYLAGLLAEYRSMTHDVDIVVFSNVSKNLGLGVKLVVGLPNEDPWSLPFIHKQLFADRLYDYDLFIYSEDDILMTGRNVEAFLYAHKIFPEQEVPGFLRYEKGANDEINYPDVHGCFHWDPASVVSRGIYTCAHFTNEHAGCYILTRQQLCAAIMSGGFLVPPHQGRYAMLESAATDPYAQCGFKKLICISHLDEFLVHHLPNRYVGTTFGVGDREVREQLRALLKIGQNGQHPVSLFETETKLKGRAYSKNYYEPAKSEILSAIPKGARSVLSIGCGCGSTERRLYEKGLRVSAVPLDPVIQCGAKATGVQIINGDLATACQELTNRKFDCLLLSNVLHLVPNPVAALSAYVALLSDDGVAIAVAPNMARLSATWKSLRGDASYPARESYERTGVHRVCRRILGRWFRSVGMKIVKTEKIVHTGPKGSTAVRRMASPLLGYWMADELVVVARRVSHTEAI